MYMKRLFVIMLVIGLLSASCNKNQLPQQITEVQQFVSAQEFTFRAQTANPMGGRSIPLTGGYDLVIKPNSIDAALPFFGRAYAPVDILAGGINFSSKRFQYSATAAEKGGWEILIRPEDVPEVQELRLNISTDGYATLQVTNTNRQAISFYGEITETK